MLSRTESSRTFNKIFCIGLNKTGTTSLHRAFQILGFNSVHFSTDSGLNIKDQILNNFHAGNLLLDGIDEFDCYSDWNHPESNLFYEIFDKQYPNSLFILNTRDLDSWLASREKHVKRTKNLSQIQMKNPDSPWWNIDKEYWMQEYQTLHTKAQEYFSDRPDDFLVFNLFRGDSWPELCDFLNLEIPDLEFPKSNTAKSFSIPFRIKRKLMGYIKKGE